MKNFNFKQILSDVLTLKSKTITILLGTIVPLFICHITAYIIVEPLSRKNVRAYLLYFVLTMLLCIIVYLSFGVGEKLFPVVFILYNCYASLVMFASGKTAAVCKILFILILFFGGAISKAFSQEPKDSTGVGVFLSEADTLKVPESDPFLYDWKIKYSGKIPTSASLVYNVRMTLEEEPFYLPVKTVFLELTNLSKDIDSTLLKKLISKVYFWYIDDDFIPLYKITKTYTSNSHWPKVYDKTQIISGKRLGKNKIVLFQKEEITNLYTPSYLNVKYAAVATTILFLVILIYLIEYDKNKKERGINWLAWIITILLFGVVSFGYFMQNRDFIGGAIFWVLLLSFLAIDIYRRKILKKKFAKKHHQENSEVD